MKFNADTDELLLTTVLFGVNVCIGLYATMNTTLLALRIYFVVSTILFIMFAGVLLRRIW